MLPSFLFDDLYVYYQIAFGCFLLTVIVLFSKFSESIVIKSGIILFSIGLVISFLLSFYTDRYWFFILHWILSSIAFFLFWYLSIYICEEYGNPYSGEGAMIIVLPVYFLFFMIISSMVMNGIGFLLRYFNS